MTENVKIKFQREKQSFLLDNPLGVFVDGVKMAHIQSNESVVAEVTAGKHSVLFQPAFFRAFRKKTETKADFNQDTVINIRYNRFTGGVDAKRLDGGVIS